ncbi:MAG TPA: 3-deoxy-D-manno-octulosonic acid transferase [Candidatus Deferrimicrobiaceae bacterium]
MAERFLRWTPAWFAYNLALVIALLGGFVLWLPWMLAARKRRANFLARLGFGIPPVPHPEGARTFWIHSVSVGETLAAAPFIRSIKNTLPDAGITISTVTLTGQETARKTVGESASAIIYFPFDLPFVCGRFLERVRPDAVIILETEIWPNFLAECASRGIPVAILNGRISERSYAGYKKAGWLFRRVLSNISFIGAQTPEDASRYSELRGRSDGVAATGNMKYDMAVPEISPALFRIMSAVRQGGGKWLVAGSTHEGEEAPILNAVRDLGREFPDLRLLLAPRHPERFDRVERLCESIGMPYVRKTACMDGAFPETARVLILDTVGELSGAYALADVAFVGGSLVPVGGHNILEPACFGVPVMVGPHMDNFREMARQFTRLEAVDVVESAGAFGEVLRGLLIDKERATGMGKRGQDLLAASRGGTERNIRKIIEMAGSATP